jgi:1,4-alpha-glucan branching enzyme
LALTHYWEDWYRKIHEDFFETCKADILRGFQRLQDANHIEVFSSAATHSYFPLLSDDRSIRWQARQGMHTYQRHFGRKARGFWIPECAYRPAYSWKNPLQGGEAYLRRGVDELLREEGIGYFFVDAHLLRGGESKGVYSERFPALKVLWEKFKKEYHPPLETARDPYLPYLAYPSDLPFFARDPLSGEQVWSRSMGYPGDGWYLEFHKKHFPGGMRYWRITRSQADLADKAVYEPEKTRARMEENASHFVSLLEQTLENDKSGIIVALFDTELFGHWWFEGPEWLYLVLKKLRQTQVEPATAGRCLERFPPENIISLPEGSWGKGGFHWIWLNEDTSWIWEKIYRMEQDAHKLGSVNTAENTRTRKQFIREKFLLESSDWPFLISTWTARDYAEMRAAEHFSRARTLLEWLVREKPLSPEQETLLESWEKQDNLFEEVIDYDGSVV